MDWLDQLKNFAFEVLGKGAAGAIVGLFKEVGPTLVPLLNAPAPNWGLIMNLIAWGASLGFLLGVRDCIQGYKPRTDAKATAVKEKGLADYLTKVF